MTETPATTPTIHPEDPDDEWLTTANTGRTIRVGALTGSLALLLVLAGGFWGGVVAEKHHGSGSTATSSRASRLAAAAGSVALGNGSGLSFGSGGGSAGLTTGTVIDVQGDVIDISDSSGDIVKVQVGPSTSVTRTSKTTTAGVQIGDSVVVTGSQGAGGSVTATAVRATEQGVSGGGLGRFGSGTGNAGSGG